MADGSGEEWFRALLDAAPVMIWISGKDAKCTYFNQGWLAYTGRSLEQEMGDGWAEGVHPDDLPGCLKVYLDAFERRDRFRMEYRLRRADGEYGWILDDGVPRYEKDGTFVGYIGSCVEITDQKNAQRQVRASSVTRALAGRLLQEIVFRAAVPPSVLRETGRALARERPIEGGLEGYANLFRDMGFGHLQYEGEQGGRVTFVATDLLERRKGAALPTCYLTLGFLEGALSATTGRQALGNEMRCQSAGHESCRFLLKTP